LPEKKCDCSYKKTNTAWHHTLDSFVDFVGNCSQKPEAEIFNSCGPILSQTIAHCGGSSGIHGEIKISLESTNNQFKLAYTKDPEVHAPNKNSSKK
jgi:hypothetical protein